MNQPLVIFPQEVLSRITSSKDCCNYLDIIHFVITCLCSSDEALIALFLKSLNNWFFFFSIGKCFEMKKPSEGGNSQSFLVCWWKMQSSMLNSQQATLSPVKHWLNSYTKSVLVQSFGSVRWIQISNFVDIHNCFSLQLEKVVAFFFFFSPICLVLSSLVCLWYFTVLTQAEIRVFSMLTAYSKYLIITSPLELHYNRTKYNKFPQYS